VLTYKKRGTEVRVNLKLKNIRKRKRLVGKKKETGTKAWARLRQ
jgi:hypothetical protein